MAIKDIFNKLFKKDEQLEMMEREDRARTIIEKKKKTPNERELEWRLEKQRQQMIDAKLRQMKDEERKGMLKSELMSKENMFVNQGNDILKAPNIFSNTEKLFIK